MHMNRVFAASLLVWLGAAASQVRAQDPPAQSPGQQSPATGHSARRNSRGDERGQPLAGKITAIDGGSLELAKADGTAAAVKLNDKTEFRKDRQPAKIADFKVGDLVFVRAEESSDHSLVAVMVAARSGMGPDGGGQGTGSSRASLGELGKEYVAGEIKSVDAPRLTVLRTDNVTQTLELNEDTSYSLDIRGLQAFPPGGEAQNASLHGQSAYSGASILNDLSGNAASQDTLATLSADTGGKAFFDSNDFSGVFSQVQKNSSVYYVLGFTSSNPLRDGRFRRLKVVVNRPDLKLDFRAGYYAGRDFEHLNRADREQQLEDELAAQLPRVDVPLFAGAAYFRKNDSHYYLAVSLVIPGSQIPFVTEKDKDNATIDIAGEAREGGKFPVGSLRDTVKLAVESTRQVRQKNVQYNTGFLLAPGNYHLKFVARENQTGRMGSFETDVQIPDLRKTPLKMSSIVLSSLRAPAASGKKAGANPLVRDQMELVPNITHVFTADQHLYLQYEVYDPAKGKNPAQAATPTATTGATGAQPGLAKDAQAAKPSRDAVRVFTSIEFLRGTTKVYESKPVVANEITAPDRRAVIFQIDLPLQALRPGLYLCQVNVIDDVSGNLSFPRFPLLIREPSPARTSTASAGDERQ